MPDEKLEELGPTSGVVVDALPDGVHFERNVLQNYRGRCANCGSEDRVRVSMIVSLDAGGKRVDSNGTVLCRACSMANDVVKRKAHEDAQHPVNFWVSRDLFDKSKAFHGFTSTSSMIRFLIEQYVQDEALFDDLEMYQDRGRDVKINAWVEPISYENFKLRVNARGMTVTDALKCLLLMYGAESEKLVKRS